jgi:hypothetical protein
MKKVLIILVSISFFVSCNSTTELEKELQELKSKQESLIITNNSLNNYIDSLINIRTNSNSIDKSYATTFINEEMRFIFDKKKLFKYLFEYANLGNLSVFNSYNQSIWKSKSPYTINYYKKHSITSKEEYLCYIFGFFDRSPENLNRFFNKESLEIIYGLFEKNYYYERSGLNVRALILLQVYEDIQDNDISLMQIYSMFSNNDYHDIEGIENYFTEAQFEVLQQHEDLNANEIKRVLYDAYSFWGRRGSEGNADVVYELIKDFHEIVSKNKIEDEIIE